MQIKDNILLAPYTTFKIGGEARYFAVVKNLEDLKEGVNFALQNSLPLFVLGGGSNLLISDQGFNGLVLKMEIKDLETRFPSDDEAEVVVGAGVVLDDLIEETIKNGLVGLENLSWIPGTVGASVVQNCGAYGVEVGDLVKWVEIFDIDTRETCLPAGRLKKLSNADCDFSYRNSIFKKKSNWIVVRVVYKLKKEEFKNEAQNKREETIQKRKENSPLKDGFGSAGCFFKNPIIPKNEAENLKKQFPEIPIFEEGDLRKISLGWLLDNLNWKGFSEGDVGVYDKHALMLVNKGEGTCEEIKNLAEKIKKDVKEKTNLDIESEVVFL
ncbi:MAG: UDP-N-acetylmuramate dehydrogenase [Patescibacteria group bacterium]